MDGQAGGQVTIVFSEDLLIVHINQTWRELQASKFVKIYGTKLLLSLRAGSKTVFVVANLFCLSVTLYKAIYG